MACHGGPDIVEDNLVLYLDAANTKSYPGTGTTWTDLSGNGVTGTLVNGATFNSGNGGYIVFDGANDYVSTINDIVLEEEDFTMGFWAFADDVSTNNRSLASSQTTKNWQDAGSWQISFSSSKLKMTVRNNAGDGGGSICLLYTSPSPRDRG